MSLGTVQKQNTLTIESRNTFSVIWFFSVISATKIFTLIGSSTRIAFDLNLQCACYVHKCWSEKGCVKWIKQPTNHKACFWHCGWLTNKQMREYIMKTAVRIFDRLDSQILYLTADKFFIVTRGAKSIAIRQTARTLKMEKTRQRESKIMFQSTVGVGRGEDEGVNLRYSKQCHGVQMLWH